MRVVVVESQAFTGSTWFSYVLASHERAFSLGNPAKAWDLFSRRPATTCRIHYASCPLWADIAQRDPSQHEFIATIREVAKASTLVLYRPTDPVFVDQIDNGVHGQVVRVEIIRDVRQRYASWKRRNPDTGVAQAIAGPFSPSIVSRPVDPTSGSSHRSKITLRHEAMVSDPQLVVEAAQELTGLDFDKTALAYWRHAHHPAHGNGVTHATVRHFQNPHANGEVALDPVYLDYLASVERGEPARFDDNRWESSVTAYELFVLDLALGDFNEAHGYQRDKFDDKEHSLHMDRLRSEPGFIELQPVLIEKSDRL